MRKKVALSFFIVGVLQLLVFGALLLLTNIFYLELINPIGYLIPCAGGLTFLLVAISIVLLRYIRGFSRVVFVLTVLVVQLAIFYFGLVTMYSFASEKSEIFFSPKRENQLVLSYYAPMIPPGRITASKGEFRFFCMRDQITYMEPAPCVDSSDIEVNWVDEQTAEIIYRTSRHLFSYSFEEDK